MKEIIASRLSFIAVYLTSLLHIARCYSKSGNRTADRDLDDYVINSLFRTRIASRSVLLLVTVKHYRVICTEETVMTM